MMRTFAPQRLSWCSLLGAALLLRAGCALGEGTDQQGGACGPITNSRPSIGLALSGGGARGGAHIGVLKALEELRVPVDCIAGTSVGAVIGGFYASGLSVEQIEEIVRDIDWDSAFLNATPRRYRSFRRKRDDHLFLVNQRPGLNKGALTLPIGLVQGQVIEMILARATAGVYGVNDFDDLAMPFRAVATDISTGAPVVLSSGDLPRALRASMSLPAALTPIEIDNRMLVDGGIAMNLPVEVAQSMGADVVVAVDITSSLLPRESMRSLLDISSQVTTLMTLQGMRQQKEMLDGNDILLTPILDEASTFISFARLVQTIEDGYDAVMRNRTQFEAWALDPASYATYVANRRSPRRNKHPSVHFVRLENHSSIADSIIETRLRDIEIGEPLDMDAVETAIGKVYGLELFQNVRYEVVVEDIRTGLQIAVQERSWGPNYLQLGISYSSSSDGNALFAVGASYLRTIVNERGGEWRATFVVGDEPTLLADLYQPLGAKGLFFFEPQLSFRSRLLNIFERDRIAAEIDIREAVFEIAAGREITGSIEVRAGLRSATGEYSLKIGDSALLPGDRFRRGELFARFSMDTLDSVAFPRTGVLTTLEWRGSREKVLSADADFDQLSLSTAFAKTWGRHTLLSTLRYDATISGRAPVNGNFRMGGFLDLSGLSRNQLSGQHASRIGASYYRRIGDLALLPAFAGISVEYGNAWNDREAISFGDALFGTSFWAGVNTPVGPVYVGAGRTDDGQTAVYLSLGRAF